MAGKRPRAQPPEVQLCRPIQEIFGVAKAKKNAAQRPQITDYDFKSNK
jgi:hypothetical protein